MRAFSRERFDAGLAIALAALALSELRWKWSGYYGGGSAWANVPLALLATLPLAYRRRRPALVLAVVGAAFLVPQTVAHVAMSFWGDFVPYAVALYTVSAHSPARRASLAIVCGTFAFGLLYVGRPEFRRANEVAFDLLVLGVAAAAGQIARHRGQLEVKNALLVHRSEEDARVAVERERSRIGGELHDVIAHNVGVMLVQSAAAQRVPSDPRRRGRHRRRRRGRRRRSSDRGRRPRTPERDRDGRPHAEARRHRGHPPHPRALERCQDPDADDVRPGRVRLRRAARTRRLIEEHVRRPVAVSPPELADLTERELEVLKLVAQGRSNSEIAAQLFLSHATVKTYMTRILTKLGLRDRTQAVVFAYESGVVRAGE